MKKRLLSLLLVGVLAVGMLAGCGKTEGDKDSSKKTEDSSKSNDGDKPLVVGYAEFSQKFSPFFAETAYDRDATDMTQVYLLSNDRLGSIINKGIEGETRSYNEKDYTYYGISDLETKIDEATGDTTYTIKLRDDVKFSDGEPVTIDDVIFSLYAFSDTDYDGGVPLFSTNIKGMKAYRANSTAADSVTPEMVQAKIDEMPETLAKQITDEIITPTLTSEFAWVETDVVPDPTKFGLEAGMTKAQCFAALYGKDYDATGKDDAAVLADIIAQYGTDYKLLGTNYGGDEAFYVADVQALAEAAIIADLMAAGQGEEVPNIAGITKVDENTVQIVTDGFEATTVYQLGVQVTPLHYYGDKSLYDYDNNKFGFTRGDLSKLREVTAKPMGAGPYVFEKFENKVIYYTANENFYLGAPKTKNVQYKVTAETDKVPGVEQGTIDLTDPTGSKSTLEQIGKINGTGEIVGDKMIAAGIDNLGYGYMGANADTVNVGGEPNSDASKALRKALMTVLAVYRDVAIDSYYGDAASIINYPISNTSWAAPTPSDADYEAAYSKGADGTPIYTDGMSADDKYAAANQAALGYFEAAGYTVENGKVTAAPEGAKMEYEIIIPAEGASDHPSFGILTDAKAALETIGFTLNVNNPSDSNVLWDSLNAGTQEMWVAAWQATPDPDMYQVYHSSNIIGKGGTESNHYHIADADLDSLMLEARTSDDQAFRKAEYKQCLEIILDWAVELPVYQRQDTIVYSPERVDKDTIPTDLTPFYRWNAEMHNIEVK